MRTTLLIAATIICMSASCDKKQPAANDCEEVMCTAMFAMINIHVTDANGQPVILDEHYTLRTSTREKIQPDNHMTDGTYTVLDDSYRKNMLNKKEEFRFVGIKDGKEVVNETFTLAADCCHVSKVSGNTEIVIK